MRWIASLVAEVYRILIRGGVFMYPGTARGYARPAAAAVRGQPDGDDPGAGGRRRHRDGSASWRSCRAAPARAAVRPPTRSNGSSATTPSAPATASARRCSGRRGRFRRLRSVIHVRQASHHRHHRIVRRRHHDRPPHLPADLPARADIGRHHRGRRLSPLRPRRDASPAGRGSAARETSFSHFGPDANLFEEIERSSSTMARRAPARPANTSTTRRKRRPTAQEPGTFTRGSPCRSRPTCCSTKGCTGR